MQNKGEKDNVNKNKGKQENKIEWGIMSDWAASMIRAMQ